MNRRATVAVWLPLLVWLLGLPVPVAAQREHAPVPEPAVPPREHFQIRFGPSYDQGEFGTGVTSRAFFFPVTLRYLGGRWDVSVTNAFIHLEAPPQITIIEGTPVRTDRAVGATEINAGLGDTILRGRYYLIDDPGAAGWWPALTPFVRLKIPTADRDKQLGTGEFDGGFGIEFDKSFGRFIVFGDAGYTFIGNPPGQDLRDRPAASIALGYRVTETVTISTLLDWRRALVRTNEDPVEIYGIVSARLTPTFTVNPYAFAGLTTGSPDFGVGIEMVYRFGRW